MKDSKQSKNWYSQVADTYTLEQRKNWYSEVANAYNRLRPRYPQKLIGRAVELAQLPADAIILEVGCGPGIATTAFAELGFSMICLEPSQEACQLARNNCAQYANVEIKNTLFEEWELEAERFNAVLAATAFHWVPPEIGYPKTAAALQDNGSLILLWNMTPQPQYEVYQVLNEVYQIHAPSVARYETSETQAKILQGFGQAVIDSGLFKGLVSEHLMCSVTYRTDDYLSLLSTYSPYLALNPQKRNSLFEDLRQVIENNFAGSIQISYLSAFHVAQKI
ncbi:MAG: class I SAM-dependent methyltransferase [Mojavia pulchra JT2-VF2]|jgi:SAM-dependent methyltransferase|uniref:Class I SAM-dependent methyltransferase n=1 Tax=Mojavia pulchra JT2-VF2 TaxID=287848 RepID=A0A951Q0X2_9NOST|nr:class I SAM-dependent methyltransferase [Mojavia pulchra JT2-VF2]